MFSESLITGLCHLRQCVMEVFCSTSTDRSRKSSSLLLTCNASKEAKSLVDSVIQRNCFYGQTRQKCTGKLKVLCDVFMYTNTCLYYKSCIVHIHVNCMQSSSSLYLLVHCCILISLYLDQLDHSYKENSILTQMLFYLFCFIFCALPFWGQVIIISYKINAIFSCSSPVSSFIYKTPCLLHLNYVTNSPKTAIQHLVALSFTFFLV